MKIVKEFQQFAVKGNVVDLAVGVIIGGAFGKIVSSLVDDMLMPLIAKLTGGVDFSNKFIQLAGDVSYATLAEAKAAGVATLNYGVFLNATFNFFLVALAVFLFIVKPMNRLRAKEEAAPAAPPPPPTQEVLLREIRDLLKSRS